MKKLSNLLRNIACLFTIDVTPPSSNTKLDRCLLDIRFVEFSLFHFPKLPIEFIIFSLIIETTCSKTIIILSKPNIVNTSSLFRVGKTSEENFSLFQINVLLPTYGKRLMGEEMKRLVCAAPPEHEGENLTSLFDRSLRCLDLYNARPEKDAMILVGILIGILFAIPVCLTTLVLWRRGFFFCGSSGPASFSRAFYKRTINEEI